MSSSLGESSLCLSSTADAVMIGQKDNRLGERSMIRQFATVLSCTVVGSFAAGSAARAQSPDELYAKAKTEGEIAFYVGGPTAPFFLNDTATTEKYPGIKVTI